MYSMIGVTYYKTSEICRRLVTVKIQISISLEVNSKRVEYSTCSWQANSG
jgi:hypothetical protein